MKASNPRFLEHHNHKQVISLLQYQIRVFANDENTKNTKKLTFGNVSNKLIFSLYFTMIDIYSSFNR